MPCAPVTHYGCRACKAAFSSANFDLQEDHLSGEADTDLDTGE